MTENGASKKYAVAFADVAGSTRLYESVGDDIAKELITALQAVVTDIVTEAGGIVQEVVGDEVMIRFDDVDDSVSCVCDIQRATEAFSAERGVPMSLRIGLHYGPALLEDGRVFGDTINVAARVVDIARGEQIIATDAVVDALQSTSRDVARRFDEVRVKGKQEALVIYDVLWRHANLTMISPDLNLANEVPPTLVLRHAGSTHTLKAQLKPFTIGRVETCDLVVITNMVSRQHASIELGRGHYMLTDSSTNGTYVRTQDGATVFLRRESLPLWGRGEIALGAAPATGVDHIIEFECS